jgi:hypothetical protein
MNRRFEAYAVALELAAVLGHPRRPTGETSIAAARVSVPEA